MSTHWYNLITINTKSKGMILSLFIKTRNHRNTIRDLSSPLLLGAILLAIYINWMLITINPKLKGTILNLFSRSGNHMNMILDLSTPLPLGTISLAININWMLTFDHNLTTFTEFYSLLSSICFCWHINFEWKSIKQKICKSKDCRVIDENTFDFK